MKLMTKVEESFAKLEQIGMTKNKNGNRTIYRFDECSPYGKGTITILGNTNSSYFIESEYQVTQEFYQKYLIQECYLEFGRLETAEGFYCISENCGTRHTLNTGINVMMNRSTGAASWMYCPAGVTCRSQSFVVRESTYLDYLLPAVHARYGSVADHFVIIEKAAERCRFLYQGILSDLKSCPYEEHALKLFLDAKLAEFMAAMMHQILTSPETDVITLTEQERNAIEYAQQILQDEISTPSTMKELARRIGLNPNKMQAAFKQMTGVTAGEYLRSYQMEKALEYLGCDLLLEDIAKRVGYKSASRFSEAFMRSYGVLPSCYRKLCVSELNQST